MLSMPELQCWIVRGMPLVLVAAAAPVAAAECPLPGTYAATITGRLPSGIHLARLALYSFVCADSSPSLDGCDENDTISSIRYLDTADCDGLYGVDPANPGEC